MMVIQELQLESDQLRLEDDRDGQPMAMWGAYTSTWTKRGEWVARVKGCWWALRGGDPLQIDWEDGTFFWGCPAE